MIIDPFAMEPTRTNVLQIPQILKEVPILEDSIDKIKKNIQILESRKKDVKSTKTVPIKSKGQLPLRFEEPDKWNYRVKKEHLIYTTTTNQYGFYKPTKHDMPVVFNGKSAKFSEVCILVLNFSI